MNTKCLTDSRHKYVVLLPSKVTIIIIIILSLLLACPKYYMCYYYYYYYYIPLQVPDTNGFISFPQMGFFESATLILMPASTPGVPTLDNVTVSGATGADFDTSVGGGTNDIVADSDTDYLYSIDGTTRPLPTKTVEVRAINVAEIIVNSSPTPEWVRPY